MHIIESYALNCGLKIDKPYVYEHYTAVPDFKFITFYKKNYPFYLEVIKLIEPELNKRDIKILQIRVNQNAEIGNHIEGNLNFGQWAYVIKHSLLHFGEDDYTFDLAGYYDVPRVILYSNTYPNTTRPYWGSKEKEEIHFHTGPYKKPSLSNDQNMNFVRCIPPEKIAKSILNLLNIEWTPPYETVFIGKAYRPMHDIVELVPDVKNPIELSGQVVNLAVRMDYNFDEKFLIEVLKNTKVSIVTDKPINFNILNTFRKNINDIIYVVNEESDTKFVSDLIKTNFNHTLICEKNNQQIKEKFFLLSFVNTVSIAKYENMPELKNGTKGLYFKSAKRIVHGPNEFKNKYQYINNINSKPDEFSLCPDDPKEDFMLESDFLFIAKLLKSDIS